MIIEKSRIHSPSNFSTDELEYNKGYEARMNKLNQKFTSNISNKETEKPLKENKKK